MRVIVSYFSWEINGPDEFEPSSLGVSSILSATCGRRPTTSPVEFFLSRRGDGKEVIGDIQDAAGVYRI